MTRLIDADALIDALGIGDLPIRLTYEINNAPTVDAIPVGFIEKEVEKMKNSENPAMRMNSVILSALIRDWRENEKFN